MATEVDPSKPPHNYGEPIQEMSAEARELLLKYAKIPEDEALAHVHKMVRNV
jgi:hypothetical protein